MRRLGVYDPAPAAGVARAVAVPVPFSRSCIEPPMKSVSLSASAVSQSVLATAFVAALACFLAPAIAQTIPGPKVDKPVREPTPEERKAMEEKRRKRIYVNDLAGLWVAKDWADAVAATRAPHAAGAKTKPLAVNIQKEGRSWPILRTDFDRAVLYRVLEIQPDGSGKRDHLRIVLAERDDEAVSAADVVNVPIRAMKGVDGRVDAMQLADPTFSKKRPRDMIRIAEGLGPWVNGAVIAGRYTDAQGRVHEFTKDGVAKLPDGTFDYEVSLAGLGAKCEYVELSDDKAPGGKRRTGFAWKGDTLELLTVVGDSPRNLKCDPKPAAVLTRAG